MRTLDCRGSATGDRTSGARSRPDPDPDPGSPTNDDARLRQSAQQARRPLRRAAVQGHARDGAAGRGRRRWRHGRGHVHRPHGSAPRRRHSHAVGARPLGRRLPAAQVRTRRSGDAVAAVRPAPDRSPSAPMTATPTTPFAPTAPTYSRPLATQRLAMTTGDGPAAVAVSRALLHSARRGARRAVGRTARRAAWRAQAARRSRRHDAAPARRRRRRRPRRGRRHGVRDAPPARDAGPGARPPPPAQPPALRRRGAAGARPRCGARRADDAGPP